MNARVYNVCMLVGWLMLVAGGVMINPGWGVAIGGAVLLAMTALSAYLVGPAPEAKAPD